MIRLERATVVVAWSNESIAIAGSRVGDDPINVSLLHAPFACKQQARCPKGDRGGILPDATSKRLALEEHRRMIKLSAEWRANVAPIAS